MDGVKIIKPKLNLRGRLQQGGITCYSLKDTALLLDTGFIEIQDEGLGDSPPHPHPRAIKPPC